MDTHDGLHIKTTPFIESYLNLLFVGDLFAQLPTVAFFLRPHAASWSGPDLQFAHFAFLLSRLLRCPWDINNDIEHHHTVVQVIHQFNLTSPENLSWDTAPLSWSLKSVFTNHCDQLLAKVGEPSLLWQNASVDKVQWGKWLKPSF